MDLTPALKIVIDHPKPDWIDRNTLAQAVGVVGVTIPYGRLDGVLAAYRSCPGEGLSVQLERAIEEARKDTLTWTHES